MACFVSSLAFASGGCLANMASPLSGHADASTGAAANTLPEGLVRLSNSQYANSVHDLFGADLAINTSLDADDVESGLVAIAGRSTTISIHAAQQFEASAYDLANQLLADANRRTRVVSCTPSGAQDAACMAQWVGSTGRRLFRRPLTADETNTFTQVGLTTAGGDFYKGAEYALAGMLQSPKFLFRTVVGSPAAQGNLRRLTDDELASSLAFLLWNSSPDDALLDAVASGTLRTAAGLDGQVTRMMADPKFSTGAARFFVDMLRLEELSNLTLDGTLFPAANNPNVPAALQAQISQTLGDLLFTNAGDYRDIYTSPVTYMNTALAPLYGVADPGSAALVRSQFPSDQKRMGLLGQVGILAAPSHPTGTSPTRRGRFVRSVLMCQPIPSPPPNVPPLATVPAGQVQTMRQRLTAHATNASCAACHSLMDPLGLAFENFDAAGAFRSTDNGATLDTSGAVDGVSYVDPLGLGQALHDDPAVTDCLVRQLFRYGMARMETAADAATLATLNQVFAASGYQIKPLLLNLVESDAFRTVQPN